MLLGPVIVGTVGIVRSSEFFPIKVNKDEMIEVCPAFMLTDNWATKSPPFLKKVRKFVLKYM